MRFSPAETTARSIGLLDAELGACPRFSPDATACTNVGVIDGELAKTLARSSVVARGSSPKRKVERASEPALLVDGSTRSR